MTSKDRILRERVTSVIGLIIMLFGLYIAYLIFDKEALKSLPVAELLLRGGFVFAIEGMGYIFLMAKDSLIEGISLGLFKVGKREEPPK